MWLISQYPIQSRTNPSHFPICIVPKCSGMACCRSNLAFWCSRSLVSLSPGSVGRDKLVCTCFPCERIWAFKENQRWRMFSCHQMEIAILCRILCSVCSEAFNFFKLNLQLSTHQLAWKNHHTTAEITYCSVEFSCWSQKVTPYTLSYRILLCSASAMIFK